MEPQQPASAELKTCPYCQREISVKATTCWWCGRELQARPERPESGGTTAKFALPRWAGYVLIGLAVLLLIWLIFFFA